MQKVSDFMTRNVQVVRPDESLQRAAQVMDELNVGSLPVCDRSGLVGMITDRDITVRATAEAVTPRLGQVRDVMTPDVVYCFEDQDVAEAARLMKGHQIRRLVVLDRDKRLVGIVSLGDLAVKEGKDRRTGDTLQDISAGVKERG